MKNPDRNTKYYFLDLIEEDSSKNFSLPKLNHFSKVHDEISRHQAEFKYCVFHTHEHLEIFYFERGKGVFETLSTKTEIKANDVFLVNSNTVHRFYSENEPLEYFNLAITNFSFNNNAKNCISNLEFEKISLKSKQNDIYSLLRKLEIKAKKEGLSALSAYSAIYELLDVLTQIFLKKENKSSKESGYKLTEKIKNYILENYDKDITVEELSKRFFMSKSYLSHTFKKEHGTSPIKFLIKARIEQAKILLCCTDKSITEISNEVGFSNPNYFAFYFAKFLGQKPSEFRKKQYKG